MAGASCEHNLIALNLAGELRQRLRERRCEVYRGDMRVKVSPTGLYTYPDVTVVCGEPEFEDAEVDTLLNPKVLVEVLSPSSADDILLPDNSFDLDNWTLSIVKKALAKNFWNKTETARYLGISRGALYTYLKHLNIE